jgi:hypothetical protein
MARRPRAVAVIGIPKYDVHDAVNTIARAREHLQNPKMMKAVRAHVDAMNEAVTGGLKPKKPAPGRSRRGMGGL